MATSKDWSAAGDDQLQGPCCTRYFADGDSTSWCMHATPDAYTVVTVRNRDAEPLYVSVGPALAGAGAATNRAVRLQQNEAQTFVLAGRNASSSARGRFSTWATDGATHAMDLTFEVSA